MLSIDALLLITVTTLVATAVITVTTMGVLYGLRRAGVAARFAIVLAGALASIVASTIVVAAEMYLSDHDLTVLVWVIVISAVLSLAAAWVVTGRMARISVDRLVGATRRLGEGDVLETESTGLAELDVVSIELAETSQRLSEARAEIVGLDDVRKQFFAWISHDLRTPLTGIRAMTEALEEGTAPDPDAYIRLIRAKSDTLDRMVDDLFQLSKLQSGTLELHPEPVVLLDLVSDAVSDLALVAKARGITITGEGIEGHMVWADPRELTRAIANVLANAVRHAPPDSTVVVRADVIDDDQLVVSVIDQGDGVTAENLGRMFDVGWRADAARTTERDPGATPGAGLGLAIVRGIVEAHGGSVHAQSTDDGFRLDLVLPMSEREAATGSRGHRLA
ncbi:HAMP domain-containing sensor histidine kinase [Humibacter soli]